MLVYILLLLIVMVVGSILFLRGTLYMIAKLGSRYFERIHRSAQFITETGKVPPNWYIAAAGKTRFEKARNSYHKMRSLWRLRHLIKHFQRSDSVSDEETRHLIVDKLVDIYNQWIDLSWEEMNPGA